MFKYVIYCSHQKYFYILLIVRRALTVFFGKKQAIMDFFEKNKQKNIFDFDEYHRINDWCSEHAEEFREIKNYVAIEVSQGAKLSTALVDKALADREIIMPFSAQELLKYTRIPLV